MNNGAVANFLGSARKELNGNILPFWLDHSIDNDYGGFRGRITNDILIDKDEPKGLVLNARILWTFAAAWQFSQNHKYLQMAKRAYDYIGRYFFDEKYGGAYWMLDCRGHRLDDKKRIYGQAFVIYALAQYYSATKSPHPLKKAKKLFHLLEQKSRDKKCKGYFETYERDWSLADDLRLSEVDMNEKKSMNTHLHILEAYTNLYRIWKDALVRERLKELIEVFMGHIIRRDSFHFQLFFDEDWRVKTDRISFGHDIEGSWLLCEAAKVLADDNLLSKVRNTAVKMAQRVLNEGMDEAGGVFYEADQQGIIDSDKHWWPQAEAVVGFLNAYELSDDKNFFDAAQNTWRFIEDNIIDRKAGEWFWKVSSRGRPAIDEPKVSEWKGPYHNTRACIEIIKRLERILLEKSKNG